ncbi:hypothetical protein LCGC14_0194880 [marine sediment metagenome]|uniref:Uncharacterized protein n=1 Tax=marine sediment metagenome TaxID=412755 RepID=A0A0F9X485_9ZZZZ
MDNTVAPLDLREITLRKEIAHALEVLMEYYERQASLEERDAEIEFCCGLNARNPCLYCNDPDDEGDYYLVWFRNSSCRAVRRLFYIH